MPVDKFGRMSDLKTKDTGVSLTYINNNYVRSDGDTPLSGSLDMRGNTIYNVADPVNPQDVVTKVYVDNTKGSGVIGRKIGDSVSIKENLDFLGKQKIKNLPDPVNDHDAVTKEYVDDKTKNLFIDENDNIAFGLNVDMEGNKIFSLPKPEQDHEPATKKYVDDLQTHYIDKRGNAKFERNINVGNNRIFALKDPKKDYEATNKKYVDDSITKRLQEEKDKFLPQDPATKEYVDEAIKQVAGGDLLVSKEGVFIKANGHYRATASLDIDNHKMENLPDPVDDKDAVNKKYIDGIVENLTLKQGLIRENGGFNLVDSYINMNFHNIRNLGLPKDESDAVPRRFVDGEIRAVEEKIQKIKEKSEERPFLKENGNYQASTSINMNFNKLLNLQKPAEPYDAATKDYVDYVGEEIKLEKRKHLIAVHASYCGSLRAFDFPFKFSSNIDLEICKESNKELKGLINGFVMPHSGRIKKIICESVTYLQKNKLVDKLINNLENSQVEILKTHFGKEDFKNDLLKEILNRINFTIENNEKKKTLFRIVKFKKYFTEEERKKLILNSTLFWLSEYHIIEKFTWVEFKIEETEYITAVMKILNNETVPLDEGDTINIEISPDNVFYFEGYTINHAFDERSKKLYHILNPATIRLLGELSFNFTFLIELDPL